MELELRLGEPKPKSSLLVLENPKSEPPVQLDLLPLTPAQRCHSPPCLQLGIPWLTHEKVCAVLLDERTDQKREDAAVVSPRNSVTISSTHTDFSRVGKRNRDLENKLINIKVENEQGGAGWTSSKGSDEEENVTGRKKLRLSKDQSAFLEESFKEHHTLNPKQKVALAKQLSLRPRQVEVWFQNRRARTKLKQTEVDCEYLRRCCETLREENRRLQKELQELIALKNTNSNPFQKHLQATTLTMCPSCENVASSTKTTIKSKNNQRNKNDVCVVSSLA